MKEHYGYKYECRCPHCDHFIDAHTTMNAHETEPPKEGDFGLCAYCHAVSKFDAHGKLVPLESAKEGEQAIAAADRLGAAIRQELWGKAN